MPDNIRMDPRGFNAKSRLRASDADRDEAAAVINNALAEGRLSAEEHSQRLDAIYAAKTHADLVPLLDDLPERAKDEPSAVAVSTAKPARSQRGGRIIAILSGATRKGSWHPEPVINVLTVLGGAELDFREAILPGNEITLRANTLLGGVEVTVPPEMRVIDNGIAILGGRDIAGGEDEVGPDSPVLRIEGVCVLGGLDVTRKPRRRRGHGQRRTIAARYDRGLGTSDALRDVRELRREIRDQVRERRHELRGQLRRQRRQIRAAGTDEDDD